MERRVKVDARKYGVSTMHITVAFGYIANAVERLAAWGMLLEAQSKKNVAARPTIMHVESVCHGNLQQYYRINYRFSCWRGHAASSVREGRSMPTAEWSNMPNIFCIAGLPTSVLT